MNPLIRITRLSQARSVLLWLLACLIALQALTVCVSMTRGPTHFHRGPAQAFVLEDFRRVAGHPPAVPSASWLGLSHDATAAQRHHHRTDDPSVVRVGDERARDAAAEDGSLALDLAVAAFVAAVLTSPSLLPAAASHRRATHCAWHPSTGIPCRLERPPRLV